MCIRDRKDVEENSYQMNSINDAIILRNRIIDLMEHAENETDPILRKALLRIVIVGGGFAGVETAGELNDFISDISEYYPNIDTSDVKVTLVEASTEILNGFPQKLAGFAKEKLVERGIDVILDAYKNTSISKVERFNLIENTINNNFAGAGIAKFVAGKSWSKASKDIKLEYIKLFKRHLALNIASMMQGYSNEELVGVMKDHIISEA